MIDNPFLEIPLFLGARPTAPMGAMVKTPYKLITHGLSRVLSPTATLQRDRVLIKGLPGLFSRGRQYTSIGYLGLLH